MSLRRLLAVLLPIVAMAVSVLGCGDDAGGSEEGQRAGPSQAFTEVVVDLKEAARSEGRNKAAKRANDLDVGEKEVVHAFCETAWQLEINSEISRLSEYPYMVDRIRTLAEYSIPDKYSAEVGAALDELVAVVDLKSLDPKENHAYKKACYQ